MKCMSREGNSRQKAWQRGIEFSFVRGFCYEKEFWGESHFISDAGVDYRYI